MIHHLKLKKYTCQKTAYDSFFPPGVHKTLMHLGLINLKNVHIDV